MISKNERLDEMKTEIKGKVQKVLDMHAEVRRSYAKFDEQIKAWEKDTIHKEEYRADMIRKLKQERNTALTGVANMFNKQLKELVAEEKKVIFSQPETKPADYQMQIANVLKLLEVSGEKLTDDQAYEILKPFQNDYEMMNLFQDVIKKLVPKQGLDTNKSPYDQGFFKKTFEKTKAVKTIIDNFEMIEQTAGNLFDSQETGLSGAVKASMFMDSINTIDQLANALEA